MGSSKSKNAPKEAAPEEGQEAHPLKTINEDEESSAEQRKERAKKTASHSRTVRINVTGDDGKEKELKRGSASSAPATYSRLQSGVEKRGEDIGKVLQFTLSRYPRVSHWRKSPISLTHFSEYELMPS